jgi:hypothetical protein
MASARDTSLLSDKSQQEPTNLDPEMEALERRARMRAHGEYAADMGEAWRKRHENEFARLQKGTIVVIHCRSGQYVIGSSRHEAGDEYERRFGKDIGYMIEIGGGIFVGGGIV